MSAAIAIRPYEGRQKSNPVPAIETCRSTNPAPTKRRVKNPPSRGIHRFITEFASVRMRSRQEPLRQRGDRTFLWTARGAGTVGIAVVLMPLVIDAAAGDDQGSGALVTDRASGRVRKTPGSGSEPKGGDRSCRQHNKNRY